MPLKQEPKYPTSSKQAIRTYSRTRLTKNDLLIISTLKRSNAHKEYVILPQKTIAALTGLQQSKVSEALDRLTYKGYVERLKVSKFDAIKLLVT